MTTARFLLLPATLALAACGPGYGVRGIDNMAVVDGDPSILAQRPEKPRVLVTEASSSFLPLFPEELDVIRADAAQFLDAQTVFPVSPVPDAELSALSQRVAGEAQTCKYPRSLDQAARDAYPNVPYADVHVSCLQQPCTLSVRVVQPPPPGQAGTHRTLAAWTAALGAQVTVDEIRGAFRRLQPPPKAQGGIVGGLLGSQSAPDPRKVKIERVTGTGPWMGGPAPQIFAGLQGALDACHVDGWSFAGTDRASLEVAPAGTVARCNFVSHRDPDAGGRSACICGALSQARFEPGEAGRRLEVALVNTPNAGVHQGDRVFEARIEQATVYPGFDPRPGLGEVVQAWSQCAAKAGIQGPKQVVLRLQAQLDGSVMGVWVVGGVPAGDALGACVAKEAQAAPLPCSPNGKPITLDVTVGLGVRAEK